MVKVSIIVPVYNVEKYISRCLNSLINQTLKDIEILIINDETKDNSMSICKEYAKNDKRIKIFNKKNEGLGLTRNYGIKKAKGEYIGFVDSDDYIDYDYYEKLYNKAKKYSSDVCYANDKVVDIEGNVSKEPTSFIKFNKEPVKTEEVLYDILSVGNSGKHLGMSVWRAIWKTSILKENNILFYSERDYISEDIIFDFDFALNSNLATFVKDTYYYYCQNNNSLTKQYRKDRFQKSKNLMKLLLEKSKKFNNTEYLEIGIRNIFIKTLKMCLKLEVYNNENNWKVKKENIREMLRDEEVKKSLTLVKEKSFKTKFFNYLLIKEKINLLIFILIIRKILKR